MVYNEGRIASGKQFFDVRSERHRRSRCDSLTLKLATR
jgi:hypothetical protein